MSPYIAVFLGTVGVATVFAIRRSVHRSCKLRPPREDRIHETLAQSSTQFKSRPPLATSISIATPALTSAFFYPLFRQHAAHNCDWRTVTFLIFASCATFVCIAILERQTASSTAKLSEIEPRRVLKQQLRLQTTALEAAANAVVITDVEGKIVWVNSAFSSLTGYSAEEAVGNTPSVLKSGCHDAQFYEQLWRTVKSGQVWRGEITNRRKDGSLYVEEMTITPVQTGPSKITHYIAIKVDVSERKRAELELRRLNRALSTLSKCNEVLVHASTEDQLLNDICKILVRSGGYRLAWVGHPEDDEQKTIRVIAKDGLDAGYVENARISWGDNERGAGPIGTALRTGRPAVVRNIHECKEFAPWREDAVRRGYAAVAALPLRFQSKIIGALAIYASETDVFDAQEIELLTELAEDMAHGMVALQTASDYLQAEAALRESEERYRLLFARNPQSLFVFEIRGGKFLDVNETALALYGYTREEFLRLNILDIRPPEDIPLFLAHMAAAKEGYEFRDNFQHRKKSGIAFDVEVTSYKFMQDGSLVSLTMVNDVTERKRAERALRDSEERYRLLYEHNLAAVFHSRDGKVLDCNEAMCRMLGHSRQELQAMDLGDLYCNAADREDGRNLLYGQGRLTNHQLDLKRKDGSVVTVIANLNLMKEGAAKAPMAAGVMLDITEIRKLQEQLSQFQKMEAIGQLTGGIAHDFNNILMIINSYSDMLLTSIEDGSRLRQPVEQIRAAGDRAAALTRQLLTFSRKQQITPIVLDLALVVSGMTKMLNRLIGENVLVDVSSAKDVWLTKADPSQVEQVLFNLAANARDAMPSGGKLSIQTLNVEIGQELIAKHPDALHGSYVVLVVSDSGCGVPPDIRPHIFEPFFTTKEKGKGTGLGLATVYGIVKQNGGFITVESEPGEGTTFSVYFPRVVAAPQTEHEDSLEVEECHIERASVLLVEDEDATRAAIEEYLDQSGYRVVSAANAEEARQRFEPGQSEHFDLLLTDVVMPGMSGAELAAEFCARHPGSKVVFMSGYSDDMLMRSGIYQSQSTLLVKPFRLTELTSQLNRVLADRAQL